MAPQRQFAISLERLTLVTPAETFYGAPEPAANSGIVSTLSTSSKPFNFSRLQHSNGTPTIAAKRLRSGVRIALKSSQFPMATSPKFEFSFDDLIPAATDGCTCDLIASDSSAHIYNEEAFRYFLEIERKRSKLSNRPFLLLLVDLKKRPAAADLEGAVADRLFSALATCLRETDFFGWYRANAVMGAVLTQHADSVHPEVQEAVRARVVDALEKRSAANLAERIQVRVYQVPPMAQGVAE